LKQKERDVWMRLWKQKAHWKRRLKICWVKAHADTLKRKSTEDEKGNQTVDKLAEDAYHKLEHTPIGENGVINQNTFSTVGAEVYIQGVRMNGNVGQQIKEQAQIERAKREAKLKPQQWGQNTNEVDWKEMLRTCKNKTIADRKGMMLDMWNGKWTNEKLHKIGWESNAVCHMCGKATETFEHLILECPCFRGAREKVPIDIAEMVKQAGGSNTLQAVIHQVLGVYRGAAPKTRDTINHWCRQQYDSNWYEGDENKTKNEMVRALAEEIVVEMKYTLPLWNGVLTKAWCKMLDIGGIQPTKSRKLAADIRVRLQQYREYIWKQRTHTKHGAEMEQENATKDQARYNESFTPLRNPARHDKVQTILTDYIADETLEWYEEVHRVATKIEERAAKKKKWSRIDETERNRNKLNKKCNKLYEAPHTQRNKKQQRNLSNVNGKSNT
jgi:hypothetical protein